MSAIAKLAFSDENVGFNLGGHTNNTNNGKTFIFYKLDYQYCPLFWEEYFAEKRCSLKYFFF